MTRSRDSRGRFARQYRQATKADKILVGAVIGFLMVTVFYHEALAFFQTPVPEDVEIVEVPTVEAKEVKIEVVYNWDEDRIVEEIQKTFHETPNTAVAVAKCESGLDVDIQSQHILSYGQEQSFGLFQIHKPDWHDKAVELGLDDYATNPRTNLELAKYIYDRYGWRMWSCYNQGLWKNYL